MHLFEETALDTFPYEITLWKRYVDDTIAVLMDELLERFTAHINAIHLAIRFTREEEEAGVIAVLDAIIHMDIKVNLQHKCSVQSKEQGSHSASCSTTCGLSLHNAGRGD